MGICPNSGYLFEGPHNKDGRSFPYLLGSYHINEGSGFRVEGMGFEARGDFMRPENSMYGVLRVSMENRWTKH